VRDVAPSEAAALLGALIEDPALGLALVYGEGDADGPGFSALGAGPLRQLAAFLTWYSGAVGRSGWGWLVDDPRAFARLVTAARHPGVPKPIRAALREAVYWADVLETAQWAALVSPAMRAEGRALVGRLAAMPAARPAGRGHAARALAVDLHGGPAA
jgi:hypothetical protein